VVVAMNAGGKDVNHVIQIVKVLSVFTRCSQTFTVTLTVPKRDSSRTIRTAIRGVRI
jgi:hypothetical protein